MPVPVPVLHPYLYPLHGCRTVILLWQVPYIKRYQLARDVNKEKRLEWAIQNKDMSFEDVIFSDKSTIQIETYQRTCCYKKGQKPRYKPKPKHPVKVHIWAGISYRGRTNLCIFKGKIKAPLFVSISEKSLVPFTKDVYPDSHRFVQDNDSKHCSNFAKRYYKEKGINWWPTPPESPDLNPIENLWHELKEYIRREVKPQTKQELILGIKAFWTTVTVDKCQRYIDHLKKVIITCDGSATGYWRKRDPFYSEICCCICYHSVSMSLSCLLMKW